MNEQNIELHRNTFYKMYKDIADNGKTVSPRGQKTLEIENYGFYIPKYVRFCNFDIRKLNVDYIKREFLWYLNGDKYDTSIAEHAKLWKSFINKDGVINSNYGQYIFGDENQFENAYNQLADDKDSRRAVIAILQLKHLQEVDAVDIPCTIGISFRIRDNKLNMTVKMRSNDSYYGVASDVPIFSFIHEMMYVKLKEIYSELEYGQYYHFAESFHIYERHFKFLDDVVNNKAEFSVVECPRIHSAGEVDYLINNLYRLSGTPKEYKFTKWLLEVDK